MQLLLGSFTSRALGRVGGLPECFLDGCSGRGLPECTFGTSEKVLVELDRGPLHHAHILATSMYTRRTATRGVATRVADGDPGAPPVRGKGEAHLVW